MANQTVSVNRNFDDVAISGLANGEDFTINTNAKLTINSDVRWGQQAAVIGAITIDSTTGGSVLIDGRDVWWIPYDNATGNVPALGTAGTNDVTGSVAGAGEFLGVFTALGVAPSTAGGAMPTTGFIKFRKVTSAFADNEVMTFAGGATADVNSATGGQTGWIHIVGETATTITVPRLGLFEALGAWFELGTTDGNDNQTFQYPVADYCPAIQVETGVGTGVYEWWPTTGTTRWAQNSRLAQDVRGKACNCTAAGVIQIAVRGAVNNGYKPAAGCRVRIPNVLVSSSSSTNWALNNYYADTANWDFTTTSAGAIVIDKTCGGWYLNFSQPYSVVLTDSAIRNTFVISECATAPVIQRCAVGIATSGDYSPFNINVCFAGGLMEDCVYIKYEQETGDVGASLTDCDAFQLNRNKIMCFGDNTAGTLTRGATVALLTITRVTNSELYETICIGSGITLSQCVQVRVLNTKYADRLENGTTQTGSPVYGVNFTNACSYCYMQGFDIYESLTNVHPYSGIASFNASYNCLVEDIGSVATPFNCGSANACGTGVAFLGGDTDCMGRRIFLVNSRTAAFTTINSSKRGAVIDVKGDVADAMVVIAGLDFTCINSAMASLSLTQASVYGTHFVSFRTGNTSGVVAILCQEPTALSAPQCAVTAGTPKFTSTGQVKLVTVGDQVTWTQPFWQYGATSLNNIALSAVASGTNVATNHSFEYQIDVGSGFTAWADASAANLSSHTINPNIGFKLKIRVTCTVANSGNNLTSIIAGYQTTTTTNAEMLYPLPTDAVGSITALIANSRVRIYNVTTAAEIYNDVVAGTSLTLDYYNGTGVSAGDELEVRVTNVTGLTHYKEAKYGAIASATGYSILTAPEVDTVCTGIATELAYNGSGITEFVSDFPNLEIDINSGSSFDPWRMILWLRWQAYNTSTGITSWFGSVVTEDAANFLIDVSAVNLTLDNVSGAPVRSSREVRVYRSDGSNPIAAASDSIQLYAGKVYPFNSEGEVLSANTPIDKNTDGTTDLSTKDVLRILLAVASGKMDIVDAGGGNFTYSYRNLADTKNRVVGTVRSSDGDRTTISTVDPT